MSEAEALKLESDRDFYRARVLAAHECARRWLWNLDSIGTRSRRELQERLAKELLDALGAKRA